MWKLLSRTSLHETLDACSMLAALSYTHWHASLSIVATLGQKILIFDLCFLSSQIDVHHIPAHMGLSRRREIRVAAAVQLQL